MSSAGADWEVAACFPPRDRRETPSGAAQSWPGAQHQGWGKSTPWISIVFTQQLYLCVYLYTNTAGCLWCQDEAAQRKQMKAIFTGALYRHSESDRNVPNSKRTVHRGCHTGMISKHPVTSPTQPLQKTSISTSLVTFFASLKHT